MAAPPPEHEASTPPDASRRDVAVQTEPPSLSPEEQLRVTALAEEVIQRQLPVILARMRDAPAPIRAEEPAARRSDEEGAVSGTAAEGDDDPPSGDGEGARGGAVPVADPHLAPVPSASDGRVRAAAAAAAAARPFKARLRWTPELHALFSAAVEAAGGLAIASPNATLLQMRARVPAGMTLPLTVQHLKSHLQKCRLEERRRTAAAVGGAGGPVSAPGGAAGGGDDEGERQRKRRAVAPPPLPPLGAPSAAHIAAAAAAAQRLLQLSAAAAAFSHPPQ